MPNTLSRNRSEQWTIPQPASYSLYNMACMVLLIPQFEPDSAVGRLEKRENVTGADLKMMGDPKNKHKYLKLSKFVAYPLITNFPAKKIACALNRSYRIIYRSVQL